MNIEERNHLRRCISETLSALRNVGDNTEVRDKLVHHLDHLLHAERLALTLVAQIGESIFPDVSEMDRAAGRFQMRTTFKDTEPEWIEWKGGACPVKAGREVEVRFRDGEVVRDLSPEGWCWSHTDGAADIVAYRVWR